MRVHTSYFLLSTIYLISAEKNTGGEYDGKIQISKRGYGRQSGSGYGGGSNSGFGGGYNSGNGGGYNQGYGGNYSPGYINGYNPGQIGGYNPWYVSIINSGQGGGYNSGMNSGYNLKNKGSYSSGKNGKQNSRYRSGYGSGYGGYNNLGYNSGYGGSINYLGNDSPIIQVPVEGQIGGPVVLPIIGSTNGNGYGGGNQYGYGNSMQGNSYGHSNGQSYRQHKRENKNYDAEPIKSSSEVPNEYQQTRTERREASKYRSYARTTIETGYSKEGYQSYPERITKTYYVRSKYSTPKSNKSYTGTSNYDGYDAESETSCLETQDSSEYVPSSTIPHKQYKRGDNVEYITPELIEPISESSSTIYEKSSEAMESTYPETTSYESESSYEGVSTSATYGEESSSSNYSS
ncbi:hypothetical protein AYI68_g5509 [Smittium mucronatum]|uniref:Uncharacterized protein n=1 Tax=Smittium mucronatum TaxID=133383 RepID=A0A1R0GU34_9FUNG|nr:hypothetical protein AYI68_g5509 [Smittium mucronatum]